MRRATDIRSALLTRQFLKEFCVSQMTDVSRFLSAIVFFFLFATFCLDGRATAQQAQQGSGNIEGRVVDAATGDALPGAKIVVLGTAAETSTDRDGVFRLAGVPVGSQTLVITYLGRRDGTPAVDVTAGTTRRLDVRMSAAAFEETVTVQGQLIADANARALNQQRT